jgi:hypothetical protein
MVIEALQPLGYTEYIHYPSLLQHVSTESSIGHDYGMMLGWEGEDYDPMTLLLKEQPMTDEAAAIAKLVPPSKRRPTVWRGGVIQIHVTRACDQACFGCTQASNLGGKPVMITPEDFEVACKSLQGYWGVVGMFGGNPAMHPQFELLCDIFAHYFPKDQRGLWCNHPRGKGKKMQQTFDPAVSNLNVHLNREAYDEFKRDWPESFPFGLDKDSRHSPPFVALQDVEPNERKRWDLISDCDINKFWSAMVCSVPGKGVRGFFCELAGAMAMLHANDPSWPDLGVPAAPGWWAQGMQAFGEQAKFYCHRCGVPLKRYGQLAIGGEYEEVSATHAGVYRPKVKGREVRVVNEDQGAKVGRVIDYVTNAS